MKIANAKKESTDSRKHYQDSASKSVSKTVYRAQNGWGCITLEGIKLQQ